MTVMIASGRSEGETTNQTHRATETSTASRLSQCRAGSTSGEDFIFALSLR